MKKALIVYDTTFGNTKMLAEMIGAGIEESQDVSCVIIHHKELLPENVTESDIVLFGSPIHAGMATHGIKSAIKKAASVGLRNKLVSTFDTYASVTKGRGVRNMESILTKVAADTRLITPGHSALVHGFRGPLHESEEQRANDFGRRIAKELQ